MGIDAGKVGLMKKSMYGTRDAACNWERDWQEHVKNWVFKWDSAQRICFTTKNTECRVTTSCSQGHKEIDGERKMTNVHPIKAKVIGYGSSKSIKTLYRRLHWRKEGIVYQHDPRHIDVLVKDFGLENDSVQTPATLDVTQEEESEPLS